MKLEETTRRVQLRTELKRVDGCDPATSSPCPKHVKMAASPMGFLRGSAQLFYADLALGYLKLPSGLVESVPRTRILGNCHLGNFGFSTEEGSRLDRVIFAPDDYDDACVGLAVWDLARYLIDLFLTIPLPTSQRGQSDLGLDTPSRIC